MKRERAQACAVGEKTRLRLQPVEVIGGALRVLAAVKIARLSCSRTSSQVAMYKAFSARGSRPISRSAHEILD
jgi:hypothetical protein